MPVRKRRGSRISPRRRWGRRRRRSWSSNKGFLKTGRSSIAELQTFDTVIAQTNTSNAFQWQLVHVPVQGTDYFNRFGDKTLIKSIRVMGTIQPGTVQVINQWFRFVVVYDRQPNNLTIPANGPYLAASVTSLPDPRQTFRFLILFDKRYNVGITALTSDSESGKIDYFVRQDLESMFNANGGAASDIVSGGLYIGWITDTAFTANNTPRLNFTSRTRFVA